MIRAVAAKLQLQALDRGGEMFVIIPQAALSPMRQALSRTSRVKIDAGDPAWARQIREEVRRTAVSLRAVLEERTITLGDIAAISRSARSCKLQATPASRVKLESSEQPLFWCIPRAERGRRLQPTDRRPIDHEQEFLNDILSR